MAAALLGARGQTLEVGPVLQWLPDPPGLARRSDGLAVLTPPADRAAAMFAENLAVWGGQAVTDGIAAERELQALAQDLALVAEGRRAASITWELRQLALQRR